MFCPSCGHDNLQSAVHCAACGTSLTTGAIPPPPGPAWGAPAYGPLGGHTEPRPDNYLVWAILVTLFCCLPSGIAAIVFAAQVDTKYAVGDYAGARESAEKAKFWSLVSLAGPVVAFIGYVILVGVIAALAAGTR